MFSLIVPTYNEAANVLPLLEAVHAVLTDQSHEIIIVDDNSPDQTCKIAEEFSKTHPWIRVFRRMNERGLSSAVIRGFELAHGDILGVMDGDLSHDERILPQLLDAIQSGADLAVGSRRIPGGGAIEWPWYRRLTSSMATTLAKVLLDIDLSDPMSGYFILRRDLYEKIKHRLEPQGYKILLEIYCKSRPSKTREIPFVFRNRREGHSKLTGSVMREYFKMLFDLKRHEASF